MQLKRQGLEIYYHKNKHKCDFLTRQSGKVINAIQVCQSLENPQTRKREFNGLLEAMKDHNLQRGFIITEDFEETLEEYGMRIQVIPVWKWLLGYEGEGEL